MTTATFEDLPISFLLIGLFIICIFAFAGGLAVNYGQNASVMDVPGVDVSGIQEQVNSTSNSALSWQESLTSDNLFLGLGEIFLLSIWGIIKLIFSTILSFLGIFLALISGVLGIPPVVTGVIIAIVIIMVIFAAWRKLKAGY